MTDDLSDLTEAAALEDLTARSVSPATRKAYDRAWTRYVTWCDTTGRAPLPSDEATVLAYLGHLHAAGRATSTMWVQVGAIRHHHTETGHPAPDSPALTKALKGYTRAHGKAAKRQARALHAGDIPRILERFDPDRTADLRDRALILLGFAGGFRRAELVAVETRHVEAHDRGLRIHIPHSKSDQDGVGYHKVIPFGASMSTCPVVAYRAWMDRAGVRSGRVFRAVNRWGNVWGEGITPEVVADVIRKRALAAGLAIDPDLGQTWSGHSLRRGFATDAVEGGAPAHKVRAQGGWKGPVPLAYFDAGEAWDDPAAGRLGL